MQLLYVGVVHFICRAEAACCKIQFKPCRAAHSAQVPTRPNLASETPLTLISQQFWITVALASCMALTV